MNTDNSVEAARPAGALEALCAAAGFGVLTLRGGQVLLANTAAVALFGPHLASAGSSLAQLSAPEASGGHGTLEERIERAAATGSRLFWTFQRADGGPFLAELRAVRSADGTLTLMLRDYSGLIASSPAAQIVDASPLPVAVVSIPDHVIVCANERTAQMLGVTAVSLPGRHAAVFFASNDDARAAAAMLERDRQLDGAEFLFSRAGGEQFWVEITARPLAFEGQTAVLCSFRDSTERRRAEAADALVKTVMDAIPATIHVKDRSFRYRMMNQYCLDTWKLGWDDVIGKTQQEVFFDGNWASSLAQDQRILDTKAPTGFYEASYHDHRGKVSLWANKIPLLDGAGEVSHILTVGMDITKLKEAEAEIARQQDVLHQTEKLTALGSLLAGVAHELNNPLSVVLSQAVLMKETATDSRTAARAEKIYAASERCARIIKSFLAIARQRPPVRTSVRPDEVFRSAVELTAYGFRSNGIPVALELADDLPPVWGDVDQLGQVLMNLIVNAHHALLQIEGRPRWLRIRATPHGEDEVEITVADNGPGIPEAIRSRIFDPFFTTKATGAGTGIGLSLCMGIIKSHGGSIQLEDTPGGGAAFVIRLPRAPVEVLAAAPDAPGPDVAGKKTILIVDDEREIALTLAEIVAPLAGQVDIAENGAIALRRLDQRRYDLIISDLRMPELDGPGLFRTLQARPDRFAGQILFVTGDTLAHNLEGFLKETGIPYLEKPFHPSELKRRVIELIGAG